MGLRVGFYWTVVKGISLFLVLFEQSARVVLCCERRVHTRTDPL